MSTVNSEIIMQGNNDAWFTANASVIYPANIQIFHINGRYKFSDGITTLSALPFLGALGYVPENIANKQNSLAVDGTGSKYVTVDAVNAGLDLKQNILFGLTDVFYTGRWWHQPIVSNLTTIGSLNGGVWFIPCNIGMTKVITEIGMQVALASAGQNIRFGFYDNDVINRKPNNLIFDSGNISAATTGFKSVVLPSATTLDTNNKIYWFAYQASNAAISIYYHYLISLNTENTNQIGLRYLPQSFGAMPANGSSSVYNSGFFNISHALKIQ